MRKIWEFFEEHMTPIVVVISFGIVLVFTIVVLLLNEVGVTVSDTLIEYFYKFFGFEMISLATIKISKHIGNAFGSTDIEFEESEGEDYEG